MFEADSHIFTSAPSVPRVLKLKEFWPAFGGDHRGTLRGGGGGSQPKTPSDPPSPPSKTSLPCPLSECTCSPATPFHPHERGKWGAVLRMPCVVQGTLKDFLHENIQDPVLEYYREKMLARTVKYIGRGGRRRAPVSSGVCVPAARVRVVRGTRCAAGLGAAGQRVERRMRGP